jgi:hypothetical protein
VNSNTLIHDDPQLTFIEIVALYHSVGVASVRCEEDKVDGRRDAEGDCTDREDVEPIPTYQLRA